jgi:hypothetical protein
MLNTTVSDKLHAARGVAWASLQPAFTHAIALAREAEYVAQKQSDEVQCNILPAYPPLVTLLADSWDNPT